jgi:RimJ/RimL family protein N-acetyltransferase
MPEASGDMDGLILRDGARLEVQTLEAADRAELQEGIENLSPESRYLRFLTPTPGVTPRDLTYLTTLDHHRHEALVAVDRATDTGIAVARYVIVSDDPPVAEIAVTVADAWQGRGVGGGLLRRLAGLARARGIARFSGTMFASNAAMIRLLSALGPVISSRREDGMIELVVELTAPPGPSQATE